MKTDSGLFPDNRTIEFPPIRTFRSRTKKFFKKSFFVMTALLGFFMSKWCWPSVIYQEIPKEVIKYQRIERIKEKEPSEEMINQLVNDQVRIKTEMLGKGIYGMVEIKDNEAQYVWRKKAAVGKIDGFEPFENITPYPIRSYIYIPVKETGCGMIECKDGNFIVMVWRAGKTKPPMVNPGKIRFPQGVRVETGSF